MESTGPDKSSALKTRLSRFTPPLVLFLLNAFVCRELFTVEYTRYTGSIEAAYVSISRIVMEHWSDLRWFPEWYGGIPQQNSYPPLLHILVAAAGTFGGMPPALAHHAVSAAFYAFGPVALYWLAARLSGSRVAGFLTGLVYSLLSPSALLSREVRVDLGGPWLDRRLDVLVVYGEGPHIAAVALLPLAIFALDRAMESRRPGDTLFAAIALAAVAATNWLGALALAAGVFCLLLARTSRVDRRLLGNWLWAALCGGLAYLLASPCIPPSTIHAVRLNSPTIGGDYHLAVQFLPLVVLAGVAIAACLKLLFARVNANPAIQFFTFFSLFMGAPPLFAYWRGIALLPQPARYHIEMDLAFCGLAAALVWMAVERRRPAVRIAVGAAVVVLLIPQVVRYRGYARGLITPIDIRATAEYKMDEWFGAHPGIPRVFAPGAASFWLNSFNDTPQLGGGFDQCRPYPWNAMITYLVYAGPPDSKQHLEASVLWLKAFGVRALGVAGAGTGQVYRTFPKPDDFASLPVLWRGDGGDAIYEIPAPWNSLAHVIGPEDWMRHAPAGALDVDDIGRYDAAIERAQAQVQWTSRHTVTLTAEMRADQLVSFQETWHEGWHARVNGRRRRVFADALGQMVIEPRCGGLCRVELEYDGGREMKAALTGSAAAWLGCFVWIGYGQLRRRAVIVG